MIPEATAARLLQVWETAGSERAAARAIALLAEFLPGATPESVRELSLGERETDLARLREQLFGRQMPCRVHCPECQEQLEFTVDPQTIHFVHNGRENAESSHSVEVDGYQIVFRLPNAGDFVAIQDCKYLDDAKASLAARCVQSAKRGNDRVEASRLPATVIDAMSARMAKLDPSGDIEFDMNCPACHHAWKTPFDILQFLWLEIDSWARRTLGQVHRLASAYGWTEQEILSLSPRRRQWYMGMIRNQ